ncbi:hypothetical protein [Phaeobacter italicus]|jgi:hypothetical protein|uniref:hypothetical protein n=1 Tax=Phaeobacter italicus TaxID=481446 RepID=UPI002FD9BC40
MTQSLLPQAANSTEAPKPTAAAEALAHLEQAWAYYTPETVAPVRDEDTDGVVDYFAAA